MTKRSKDWDVRCTNCGERYTREHTMRPTRCLACGSKNIRADDSLAFVYIGAADEPQDREKVPVSHEDWERVGAMRGTISRLVITNLASGERIRIRSADCGLAGCRCAVERVETNEQQTSQAED